MSKMSAWVFGGAVALTLAATLLASGASASPKRAQAAPVKLGFITKFPVDFYFTLVDAAKAWQKKQPGLSVMYASGKSATDDAGEIAAIQDMVASGVKGIAITPTSAAVIPALNQGDQGGRQGSLDGQRPADMEG